ncbi:MAG TPA: hypothetical protein VGC04_10995 [Cellulomonas sp.]
MDTRIGRVVTGAAGLALLAALAGCDPGSPSVAHTAEHTRPAAQATVAAPATTTAPAPTATGGIALTVDDFAAVVSRAQANLALQTCHFTVTVSTAGQEQMDTTGDLHIGAGGQVELVEHVTLAGQGEAELRLVGGVLYVETGNPGDRTFEALDPNDPSLGIDMPTDVNPAGNAADLAPAILSVAEAGEPVLVGGVPTQGYDVVVDLAKVTGPSGARLHAAQRQAASAGQSLPPMVTYHYWLAADGLTMRVSYEMFGAQWAMTFSQWGQPVEIQAPTADQIVNLDQD